MTITELPKVMLICLFCTILMEVTAAYIMHVRKKEDFIMIILVNILTNPLLTSITAACFVYWGYTVHYISEAFLEITVVIVEALLYRKTLRWKGNPLVLSLVLNSVSYLLGKAVGMIIF